jgi:citrate synthase
MLRNPVICSAATASFFPIGWSADQVMGFTVSKMHGPVPHWHEQIGNAVNKLVAPISHSFVEAPHTQKKPAVWLARM